MRKTVKLYEVATVSAGNTAPQDKKLFKDGIHHFVRTADVGKIHKGIIFETKDRLNDSGISKLRLFPKGTILFPKSGASTFLNHRVILGMDAYVASHLATIKGNNSKILDSYLFYTLQKIDAAKLVADSGYPSLRTKKISEIQLVLPPLSEQQHIVAKLDKVFAEVDKIKLKIKNQEELLIILFKNYLNSIFQKSKFKSFKIGDIPGVHSGGTPSSKNKKYWDGTISWYSSGELNDYKTKNSIKKITKLGLEKSNAKIFPKNSLLIGIYDTAAMKMSILHQEATFNQAIVGIPPNSKFETEYLFFALTYLKNSILLERRGVRQMNLSLAKIKNIQVPKLSLEEQKTIVYHCNEIKKQSENLKNLFSKKLSYFELLKKSFLINIFSTDKVA